MNQEQGPRFQRSFIPKVFFVIISLTLVFTLKIINKHESKNEHQLNSTLIADDESKSYEIPEINAESAADLTLYISNDCPYCNKVTEFLRQEKIGIATKNVTASEKTLQELTSLTKGKEQVPCLKANDKYLFESSEIIKQLREVKKNKPELLTEALIPQEEIVA